jgi:hypothetical protein
MKVVAVLMFMAFVSIAHAESLDCGDSLATVTYGTKSPYGYESVSLNVKTSSASVNRKYEYVWFGIACLTNPDRKKFLVYQAYCSGSACQDLDNWGIIDSTTLEVLIEPADENLKEAESIFGAPLKPFQLN